MCQLVFYSFTYYYLCNVPTLLLDVQHASVL